MQMFPLLISMHLTMLFSFQSFDSQKASMRLPRLMLKQLIAIRNSLLKVFFYEHANSFGKYGATWYQEQLIVVLHFSYDFDAVPDTSSYGWVLNQIKFDYLSFLVLFSF